MRDIPRTLPTHRISEAHGMLLLLLTTFLATALPPPALSQPSRPLLLEHVKFCTRIPVLSGIRRVTTGVRGERAVQAFALGGGGVRFPSGYDDVVRRAAGAVNNMLKDNVRLMEVEFPVTGLAAVQGDGEGAGEMTLAAQYTREILNVMSRGQRKNIRLFFPDEQEAKRQMDLFKRFDFVKVDFLTRPTALGDLGLDPLKVEMKDRIRDEDDIFIIAYPSFNPNEMIAVRELADQDAKERPIVVINGELDRIRSGYYPRFFYPRLNKAMDGFLSNFDQALYLHNFKGNKGGALFREYPGEYTVFTRDGLGLEISAVHSQSTMPTLKEVSLTILPQFYS